MFQGAIIVFSILVIFIAVCILPWWVSVWALRGFHRGDFLSLKESLMKV